MAEPWNSRLLIVDDHQSNVELLEAVLRQAGYTEIATLNDSRQVLDLCLSFQPDLILLDLLMPYLDGYSVITLLRTQLPNAIYLPILVLTADSTREARHRALRCGANDFLTKPIDAVEVRLRVGNLLETRRLHRCLQMQNSELEAEVQARTYALEEAHTSLEAAYDATLGAWAHLLDLRDHETEGHTRRVTDMTLRLAVALGLSGNELVQIRRGALLHDIGKMGIPDSILLKPGPLTLEEWQVMRRHPVYAYETLSEIPFLRSALAIPTYHHEKWDGSGYPHGLRGNEIPLAARIFAVVDVWDALTNDRPYRAAWDKQRALEKIISLTGSHFDPQIVTAFLQLLDKPDERRALAAVQRLAVVPQLP